MTLRMNCTVPTRTQQIQKMLHREASSPNRNRQFPSTRTSSRGVRWVMQEMAASTKEQNPPYIQHRTPGAVQPSVSP